MKTCRVQPAEFDSLGPHLRLAYTMLTKDEAYADHGQTYCDERYRERVLRQPFQRANKLGKQLVAALQAA